MRPGILAALPLLLACINGAWSAPAVAAGAGAVGFSTASYSVLTSEGAVIVSINRDGGATGAATASYLTLNGTAVAGTDYSLTSGTVSWGDGDASPKSFIVPITATGAGGCAFTVVMLSASGASFGAPLSANVAIVASSAWDTPGTVEFSQWVYSVAPDSLAATISLDRVGGAAGAAAATYLTLNGSAVAGTDFTLSLGSVAWSNGDASPKSFNVPISPTAGGGNSFSITLLSASGASFGNPMTATVDIAASASAAAAPTGNATVSWARPTTNSDGSALSNLAGYNIYYGTSATALAQKISIDSPGQLSDVISSLSPGIWYFAMTSVNAAGLESALSPTVRASL